MWVPNLRPPVVRGEGSLIERNKLSGEDFDGQGVEKRFPPPAEAPRILDVEPEW
jgi:hypothetical protein